MIKISVAIPAYNVELYLRQALDSVLAQTCKAYEIYGKESYRVGQIVETELAVDSEDKEKFKFETEVFGNGYKVFQFLKRSVTRSNG